MNDGVMNGINFLLTLIGITCLLKGVFPTGVIFSCYGLLRAFEGGVAA